MKFKRFLIATLVWLFLYPSSGFTWNALGHQLIAQIAYDQLTLKAKRTYNRYNRALNRTYPPLNWTLASVWLDTLRHQKVEQFKTIHYIEWYFSEDNMPLPPTNPINAISGLNEAINTIKSNTINDDYSKGIALRIILHVVGDIHQPLHTVTKVSREYPQGDQGGNLVKISNNGVANNLHAYWDNGGGYLKPKTRKKSKPLIRKMAKELELTYPCSRLNLNLSPENWAKESHALGIQAYEYLFTQNPTYSYKMKTINITQKQIALAGCRLGALLNSLV